MDESIGSDTETRVSQHSDPEINDRIRRQIEANVLYYADRLDQIDLRLQELKREWDVERAIQLNFGIVAMAFMILGIFSKKWLIVPLAAGGFFFQHIFQGWCPPVPLFRRLGIRTTAEINSEKYALKALRGDFAGIAEEQVDSNTKAYRAIQATRWT